jgi:hypothetical protein
VRGEARERESKRARRKTGLTHALARLRTTYISFAGVAAEVYSRNQRRTCESCESTMDYSPLELGR